MIGKKVRVFWPVDNSWYTGVVLQYDANTGEHLLKYDDEDTEWVKVRFLLELFIAKLLEKRALIDFVKRIYLRLGKAIHVVLPQGLVLWP